jgi:hypothetical protein
MKFIPHCRGQTRIGKITMKLQNLIHIVIGIVCVGLVPRADAVVPAPDGGYPGGNTAVGQNALFSLTTGTFNTAVGVFSLGAPPTVASTLPLVPGRCLQIPQTKILPLAQARS